MNEIHAEVNTQQALEIIRTYLPHIQIESVQPITAGWDNFVLEINQEYIFRFARRGDVRSQLEKEASLLPTLRKALPVPIPDLEFIWSANQSGPIPFLGYRKLEGTFLDQLQLTPSLIPVLADSLAQFLTHLHRFPVQQAAQLGVPSATVHQWMDKYRQLYRRAEAQIAPLLDARHGQVLEEMCNEFLTTEHDFVTSLVHCDLLAEHILVDPQLGAVSGVIDWGDVAIGDPALDFVGLWHDCGSELTEQVLSQYKGRIDATWRQRMAFYTDIIPVYQILYGLDTQDEEHLGQGLARLSQNLG